MRHKGLAIVGSVVAATLILTGCHRLGLVTSPSKTTPSTTAIGAPPATTTGEATSAPSGGAATSTAAFTIAVQNGGGIKGRGAAMVTALHSLGFAPAKATNAQRTNYASTVILYKPGHQADAARVQKALAFGKVESAPAGVAFSTDVLVVVGKDY